MRGRPLVPQYTAFAEHEAAQGLLQLGSQGPGPRDYSEALGQGKAFKSSFRVTLGRLTKCAVPRSRTSRHTP